MPNHIHGIIEITFKKGKKTAIGEFQSPSHSIGSIIRGFKIATIKKIKDWIINNSVETGELQFAPSDIAIPIAPTEKIKSFDFKLWQRNYYEIIIRDFISYYNISEYIKNNPAKWADDKFNKK